MFHSPPTDYSDSSSQISEPPYPESVDSAELLIAPTPHILDENIPGFNHRTLKSIPDQEMLRMDEESIHSSEETETMQPSPRSFEL
jgi:hypothetical protein